MAEPQITLVIPTNRPAHLLEFFEAWKGIGGWNCVIVVEDNETKTPQISDKVGHANHFSWAEIAKVLGQDAWIISKRDSAIRSFGYLMAYRGSRYSDYVVTLDDDCRPYGEYSGRSFVSHHIQTLQSHPVWVESVPGRRTRGLPYKNRGTLQNVMANAGFWADVCDDDSLCALVNDPGYFEPPTGARIVPRGQLTPICGMNLFMRVTAVPLFYFPLMGEGQPYRRFDDIWGGLIAQHVCAHLGWHISLGEPNIRHVRASDPFKNLIAEAPGVAANETMWERITSVRLTQTTAVACVKELGEGLQDAEDNYTRQMGRALEIWAGLFGDKS